MVHSYFLHVTLGHQSTSNSLDKSSLHNVLSTGLGPTTIASNDRKLLVMRFQCGPIPYGKYFGVLPPTSYMGQFHDAALLPAFYRRPNRLDDLPTMLEVHGNRIISVNQQNGKREETHFGNIDSTGNVYRITKELVPFGKVVHDKVSPTSYIGQFHDAALLPEFDRRPNRLDELPTILEVHGNRIISVNQQNGKREETHFGNIDSTGNVYRITERLVPFGKVVHDMSEGFFPNLETPPKANENIFYVPRNSQGEIEKGAPMLWHELPTHIFITVLEPNSKNFAWSKIAPQQFEGQHFLGGADQIYVLDDTSVTTSESGELKSSLLNDYSVSMPIDVFFKFNTRFADKLYYGSDEIRFQTEQALIHESLLTKEQIDRLVAIRKEVDVFKGYKDFKSQNGTALFEDTSRRSIDTYIANMIRNGDLDEMGKDSYRNLLERYCNIYNGADIDCITTDPSDCILDVERGVPWKYQPSIVNTEEGPEIFERTVLQPNPEYESYQLSMLSNIVGGMVDGETGENDNGLKQGSKTSSEGSVIENRSKDRRDSLVDETFQSGDGRKSKSDPDHLSVLDYDYGSTAVTKFGTDRFHSFPTTFDPIIVGRGTVTIGSPDDPNLKGVYKLFRYEGSVGGGDNVMAGVFEVGILEYEDGRKEVRHRLFTRDDSPTNPGNNLKLLLPRPCSQ
jgi:hypothetical protein